MLVSHLVEINWKKYTLTKGLWKSCRCPDSCWDCCGYGAAANEVEDTRGQSVQLKATLSLLERLHMRNLGLSNWLNLFRSHAPAKGLLITNEFTFPAVRTPADDRKKEVTKLFAVGATDTGCLLNTTLVASQKNGWRNPQEAVSPTYTFPHRSSALRPQPELQEHRDAFIQCSCNESSLAQNHDFINSSTKKRMDHLQYHSAATGWAGSPPCPRHAKNCVKSLSKAGTQQMLLPCVD